MFFKTMKANSLIFCRMILYYGTLFLFIRHSKENLECNKLAGPCCVNQYLNEANNSCSECPYGNFGLNCKSSCPPGYYGRLCKSPCECNATECHHETGCETTNGTPSVQPREDLRTEPTFSNVMSTLNTKAKEKHTQGKLNNYYSYRKNMSVGLYQVHVIK
eukprot:XP_011416166.1 PREDICTED: N-acetylglucosamine-1-phosphodiester alpha-N-acetylglucosaminidase-like [Crassostrea gigas]